MEQTFPITLQDKILLTVSQNDSINLNALSEIIDNDNVKETIYELVYQRLLYSRRVDINTDQFHLPEEVEKMLKEGLNYNQIVERRHINDEFPMKALLVSMAIVLAPTALILLCFGFTNDAMAAGIVTLISVGIYVQSSRSKYPLTLKSLAILILIHFLIFPALYATLLQYQPKSLTIDETVKEMASESAKNEAIEKFEPKKTKIAIQSIEKMLSSKSLKLSQDISDLEKFNIVMIDTFLLYKSVIMPLPDAYVKDAGSFLNICNKNGTLLTKIKGPEAQKTELYPLSGTNRDFLLAELLHLREDMQRYKTNELVIKQNRFWTYLRVLPHAANIFDLGNIVPKSGLANLIYTLHKILFVLLAAICALTDFAKEQVAKYFANRNPPTTE